MVPARVLAVVVAACCGAAALVYTVTPRNADRPPAPPPTATVSKVEATRYRDAAVKFYMQSGDEGRKVSDAFGNDADFAGVRRLMDVFLNEGLCQPTTVVLIGGVNEGQLASKILELCPSLTLHGFEVQEGLARSTGELLAAIGINAVVRHLGMGDEELDGIAVTGQQGSEQAGLYTAEGRWSDEPVQGTVSTVKLSRWAPRQGIDSVAYLVIDAEGFEPKIIRGMELHLESSQRLFPLFQFELGGTWADEDSVRRHSGPPPVP
jgi:FkbM family methyltransferase